MHDEDKIQRLETQVADLVETVRALEGALAHQQRMVNVLLEKAQIRTSTGDIVRLDVR
jgi:uncharacterized coiled-coil protein SlyX